MSDPTELPADESPKSGEWVDPEEFVPTEEEEAEGKRLGETIDTDDDEDNGLEDEQRNGSDEG